MTLPIWMLLGFAAWTLLLLLLTVGVYRWAQIFAGRAGVGGFSADHVEGAEWYRRSMRAHANCVENLPVFPAIMLAVYVSRVSGPLVDYLSMAVLVARVIQSSIHVSLPQSDRVVAFRFTFFSVQFACFVALMLLVARQALPTS